MNLKTLTQNLAMSEMELRKGQTGTTANLRGILNARSSQLEELQSGYPKFYESYVTQLDARLQQPYDFAAIKNSIAVVV